MHKCWITTLTQLLRGLFVTGYPVPTKPGNKTEETNPQGSYKVQSEGHLGNKGLTASSCRKGQRTESVLISLGSIPCLGKSQSLRLNRI